MQKENLQKETRRLIYNANTPITHYFADNINVIEVEGTNIIILEEREKEDEESKLDKPAFIRNKKKQNGKKTRHNQS